MKQLNIAEKQSVSYCIPLELRDAQIRLSTRRIKDRIQPHDKRSDRAAIVGFGPSLKTTWRQIKKFKYIFSCSGSHRFLLEKKIIPTWHVEVDPREHKVKLIGPPHKDVEYLIASCCHPRVFDHLSDYRVRLWHVFAQDGESEQVLPRGEWAVTGGCDVGMRAMTLARFLGFTEMHIFGMDGCFSDDQSHADTHPNRPQIYAETEYKGKKYRTTPALLESARQVFHELDQMPDVNARFYGEGLIQEMAKDYQRKPSSAALIAFSRPELISEELRDLNARLHRDNAAYGIQGGKHAETVKKMLLGVKREDGLPPSVLDYGCGKGGLKKALGFPIYEYDPAIPGKEEPPLPADLVCCFDVLEHIEPDKLKYVLDDLRRVTRQVGYFVIHIGAAKKTYADGRNTHLIQKDAQWWAKQIGKYFHVGKVVDHGHEIHVVVGPQPPAPQPAMSEVRLNGTKAKFFTPNDVTKWRAETLLTKEPSTIEWINSFQSGEVFYDVGANVGGYSIWAARHRGVQPFAFEPQADNYALLVQNMRLNQIEPNAYCLALSDKEQISRLHLSGGDAGGSCHSFGEAVGPDLQPRTNGSFHGAVGMPLDELVERGLPKPNHIKIDVDGFEFRVIKGAEKTLSNCAVKSLLVEVNDSLPEHREMIRYLGELGYEFDTAQVERAKRKDGPFKGVGEIVFTKRRDETEQKLLRAIERAQVINDPFPHFVMEFPVEIELPDKYIPIEKVRGLKGYPNRFVADFPRPTWNIKNALLAKFGLKDEGFTDEYLLIKDKAGYAIGPHTDNPARVLSLIAYIGKGRDGTSLYVPKDPGFVCKGGPHHPRELFRKVKTVPYRRNTALVFLKTDKSFHGVEPTKAERNVLLYDIRHG